MSIDYNLCETRIRLSRVIENLEKIRAGRNAWPVVKADAYGHGLKEVSELFGSRGYGTLCVGTVGEAAQLRAYGCPGRIVSLLGPVEARDFDLAAEHDVLSFVYEASQIKALSTKGLKTGKRLPVCVKIDSGMSRLGFLPSNLRELLDALALAPGVKVVAAASHLSSADDPAEREFTLAQAASFKETLDELAAAGHGPLEATLANSAASLAYPDMALDAVRPGIGIYGANPFHGTELEHLGEGLSPAMEVLTRVASVKDLPEGASISYGRTFVAPRDMRVAVVAAGYADAFSRSLTGKGEILIRARRAPILGRVCMQLSVVDVTHIPEAKPGDEAWLLGGPGPDAITPEELAGWWGTIPYEVFCMLGLNKKSYLP
jgi:alanine racemase